MFILKCSLSNYFFQRRLIINKCEHTGTFCAPPGKRQNGINMYRTGQWEWGGGGFSRQVRGWGVAGQNCIGQTVEGTDRVRYSKQILCFLSAKMWKLGYFFQKLFRCFLWITSFYSQSLSWKCFSSNIKLVN